jgi:hypothetical protein
MSLSCVVGMHDIIWQQHETNNYHKGERNPKLSRKQYGVDQPEQIHFNTATLTAGEQQAEIVKNKFIKNTQATTLDTQGTKARNHIKTSSSQQIQNKYSNLKTEVNGKWSVAIDDNQNTQVSCSLSFSIRILYNRSAGPM